jgi:putative YhbY family RNA-binding protein
MDPLTPAQRRDLRAKAHHLHPVVTIGHHGLTPAVLHEIDVALLAHELIKIRVLGDDRTERSALLERICAETGATAVQHLGKLLIVWRPAPERALRPR